MTTSSPLSERWPRLLELTWYDALDEAIERLGAEHTAFVFEGPDWASSLTLGQWRTATLLASAALAALGARPGDCVAALGPGGPMWPIVQLACSHLGTILVPINSRYRHDEMVHVLRMSEPVVVIAAERVHTVDTLALLQRAAHHADVAPRFVALSSADVALGAHSAPTVQPAGDAVLTWDEFLSLGAQSPVPVAATDAAASVLVQFTSGTTAFAKGALLSAGATLGATYHLAQRMGLTHEDRCFSTQPFYHVGGSVATTLMPLGIGCTMVAPERYTVEETFRIIPKHRCTARTGQAAMYWMELGHERFSPEIFATVSKGWAGGTYELLKLIVDRMGITGLTQVYGMTEVAATTTVPPFDAPEPERLGTCGRPLPDLEVGILGEDGVDTAPSAGPGEVCIRGWSLMNGYLGDVAATAATVDDDGWLHSGDLGRLDADGNLLIVDRLKDMIKPGGENVSPAEVERVISTLSGVIQVSVVGVPDERLGEVPVAFVEVRPGSEQTGDAIIASCAAEMASFKVPRQVHFVTEWPMTESGKIQKPALRERAAGDRTSIIGATG